MLRLRITSRLKRAISQDVRDLKVLQLRFTQRQGKLLMCTLRNSS